MSKDESREARQEMTFQTFFCRPCGRIIKCIPQDGLPKCYKCGQDFEAYKGPSVAVIHEFLKKIPPNTFIAVPYVSGKWYAASLQVYDEPDTPIIVEPPPS